MAFAVLPPKPSVVWQGMTYPRYSPGRPGSIRVAVLHATAGQGPGDLAWLTKGGDALRPVSCHYYISKAGRIVQLVKDDDTAWHCGASAWVVDGAWVSGSVTYAGGTVGRLNALAIGVELENRNDGRDPYPALQLTAAVALLRYLVAEYDIPPSQLVRHLDIAPGRKTDPAGLAWPALVKQVYAQPAILTTPGSPLLGPASGTPASAIAYLSARASQYPPADIAHIVQAYRRHGTDLGVDWFLALAQCAHETGSLTSWWCARPRRNPAGIGVTGHSVSREMVAAYPERFPDASWAWGTDGRRQEGLSFARWDPDAIRAHLGRLLAYALPAGQGTPVQQVCIAEALALRPLPASHRGCAPMLKGLGGTWAVPGDGYAARVAAMANAMREAA